MKRTITKMVFYFRLSKPKRGKGKAETIQDAYGIAAQERAADALRKQYGAKVIAVYKEIENATGKRKRPELAKAINHARLNKATLVIGKLDRLARNVAFTSALMEAQIDFIACDIPDATKFTIHIMAAMAEEEARTISERTRNSLAEAKEQGKKLGSARPGHWKGREHKRGFKQANKASAIARLERAKDAYRFLIPEIRRLQTEEQFGLRKLSDWLNEQGHVTTRGSRFHVESVRRVLEMFDGEEVAV
jgi:DNA invertase Pin-like site-specific DNA recombinase